MAEEELQQSRTEAPTPRRREEAREQGRVAFSAELNGGLVLLAGLGVLALGARTMASGLLHSVRLDWLPSRMSELGPEQTQGIFFDLFSQGLGILGIFLGAVVVIGLASSALQVGFVMTPGLLVLNFERLSPAQGWTRLFSLTGGMRGALALVKVVAVAAVAFWVLHGRREQIAGLSDFPLPSLVGQAWAILMHLGLTLAGTLIVFGIGDYAWQRWRLEQSLRMTRQELKEEVKRDEGDPQIKARIRKLQREAAQKRMFQDVPRATVVITNPTHLAVALRYERNTMAAPQVVAKGAGYIALRIADMARRHGVPVVERKPLAQALYKAVKVGQDIPAALYVVVAEVLAYVYRLRGGDMTK
jgi:flagellar biosynthetic protein FlhB